MSRDIFFPRPESEKFSRHPAPGDARTIELQRFVMVMLCAGTTLFDSGSDASIGLATWPTMVLSETVGLLLFSVIRGGIA
jgi:hypothetical protein